MLDTGAAITGVWRRRVLPCAGAASRGELWREVAVEDLEALQVGAVRALQARARRREAFLGRPQAARVPHLEVAPAHAPHIVFSAMS